MIAPIHGRISSRAASVAGWVKWAALLSEFVAECGSIMERCPGGKKRFPSHVTVIVIDNLNGSGADYEVNEAKLSEEKKTSMTKFRNNVQAQAAIDELVELIDCFKSAVYCQTAPAKHWGMPAEVDKIADDVRRRARENNIAMLDATQFWRSIRGFMEPDSLEVKPGENAGEAQSDKMSFTGTATRRGRRRRFRFIGTDISSASCATWIRASSTSP